MKKYQVTIPISGVIYVDVEAESEEEALEKGLEMELKTQDIAEWETHSQIVQGNVFHGHTNTASAEETDFE
jgi:hypothetical protein